MSQNYDYNFYGGGGFGGINKPKVTKSIIVPVTVSAIPTSSTTDSCVYKAKKTKRRVKVRKSNTKKSSPSIKAKKRKSHKKIKSSKVPKKLRFQNF